MCLVWRSGLSRKQWEPLPLGPVEIPHGMSSRPSDGIALIGPSQPRAGQRTCVDSVDSGEPLDFALNGNGYAFDAVAPDSSKTMAGTERVIASSTPECVTSCRHSLQLGTFMRVMGWDGMGWVCFGTFFGRLPVRTLSVASFATTI